MKLLLLLFCFPFIAIGQNIVFEKKLDHKLKGPIINTLGNVVQYLRVKGEGIIRIDSKSIALYDEEMNRLWITELEKVKAVGNENYFYCSPQKDHIYLAQFGVAYSTKGVNVNLHKLNYSDGAIKTIKLDELVPMRTVTNIEILDDKVFVFGVGTKGVFTPYGNKFMAYQPIVIFDQNLELLDSSKQLPIMIENTDFNTVWTLKSRIDNTLEFLTYYALDAKGQPTKSWDKAVNDVIKVITIDGDGMIEETERQFFDGLYAQKEASIGNFPKKYDPKKYQIYVDDKLYEEHRLFNREIQHTISVESNGQKSGNLVKEYLEMAGNDVVREFERGYILFDVLEDPINKTLQLIGKGFTPIKEGGKYTTSRYYCLTLDKSLKLAHVQEFDIQSISWQYLNYTDLRANSKVNLRSWGAFPDNYKMNGFEYSHVYSEKYVLGCTTVISLDDSQLVVMDDFGNKETRIVKIGQ